MAVFELRFEPDKKRVRLIVPYRIEENTQAEPINWKKAFAESLAHSVLRHRLAGPRTKEQQKYWQRHFQAHIVRVVRKKEKNHELKLHVRIIPKHAYVQMADLLTAAANYLRRKYMDDADGLHAYL